MANDPKRLVRRTVPVLIPDVGAQRAGAEATPPEQILHFEPVASLIFYIRKGLFLRIAGGGIRVQRDGGSLPVVRNLSYRELKRYTSIIHPMNQV